MFISADEIAQTIRMIQKEHLDIRTVTMGISLLDCADRDIQVCCQKIYDKITRRAENLVKVGEAIYETNIENLSYMPCGEYADHSTRVLCSPKMEELIATVCSSRCIIIRMLMC